MPLYLVETIQSFHVKYVIEANNESDAMDEIVWQEGNEHLEELSQKFLGETLLQAREISQEEFEKTLQDLDDNTDPRVLASPWIGPDRLINKIDYSN